MVSPQDLGTFFTIPNICSKRHKALVVQLGSQKILRDKGAQDFVATVGNAEDHES